jgi:hypothetical protein
VTSIRIHVSKEFIVIIVKVERISFFRTVLQLLVAPNDVSDSLIISTLMMKAIYSSETSVLTRATCRHIPEDGILLVSFCIAA